MSDSRHGPLRKAFFLVGPTAVGKSSVAQYIAESNGSSIISADSMLIYKGMDVGTATPSEAERGDVTYYGINLADPSEQFSAWDYVEHLRTSLQQNEELIVAGGTGLYVKCLLQGIRELPGADRDLREKWDAVVSEQGIQALRAELEKKHPQAYESVEDKQNPRRLVRALELAESGVDFSEPGWSDMDAPRIPGLRMESAALYARIAARVEEMYEIGFLEEVEELVSSCSMLSSTASGAIGYAEAIAHIRGECSVDEAKTVTVRRTKQLARRQMTWFRNKLNVDWIEITPEMNVSDIAEKVEAYWRESGPCTLGI